MAMQTVNRHGVNNQNSRHTSTTNQTHLEFLNFSTVYLCVTPSVCGPAGRELTIFGLRFSGPYFVS